MLRQGWGGKHTYEYFVSYEYISIDHRDENALHVFHSLEFYGRWESTFILTFSGHHAPAPSEDKDCILDGKTAYAEAMAIKRYF